MWFEEPSMTNVLFSIQTNNQEYLFTHGIWSEEPGMTKVLFNIYISNREY